MNDMSFSDNVKKIDVEFDGVDTIEISMEADGSHNYGGSNDHRKLLNRDAEDQHPISSITDLDNELTRKANADDIKAIPLSTVLAILSD